MDYKYTQEIRGRISEYLERKGLPTEKGKLFHCLDPKHDDLHPSMGFNPDKNQVHCFSHNSLKANFDIFDLIGFDYNLKDFSSQYRKACEIFGYPISSDNTSSKECSDFLFFNGRFSLDNKEVADKDFSDFYRSAYKNRNASISYMLGRGLSADLVDRFKIGYYYNFDMNGQSCNAIIIPVTRGKYIARNVEPDGQNNIRYHKVGTPFDIWNAGAIDEAVASGKPLFVTEGVFDALSIINAGGCALALCGTGNIDRLLSYLDMVGDESKKKIVVITACDNDDVGLETNNNLIEKLRNSGFICYFFKDLYDEYKDANEMLAKNRDQFCNKIGRLQTEQGLNIAVFEENGKDMMQELSDEIERISRERAMSTGFSRLDEHLRGGIRSGLYVLGAEPSMGKTTMITQIKDSIVEQGNYVLFFSLETRKIEILAKSISRYSYKKNPDKAKDVIGILDGRLYKNYDDEEKQVIQFAMDECKKFNKKCRIFEGLDIDIDYIKNETLNFIRSTGIRPVIFVDYLQIVGSGQSGVKTDKQQVDIVLKELRKLSMEQQIPVIVISSLNRDSYHNALTLEAFKNSGDIEYKAEYLLVLQYKGIGKNNFDLEKAQKEYPRRVELKFLKFKNGGDNTAFSFRYLPNYNYFCEDDSEKVADNNELADELCDSTLWVKR